jgi:hypothetical protein
MSGMAHNKLTMPFGQPLESVRKVCPWLAADTALSFGLLCFADGGFDHTFRILLDDFAVGGFVFAVAADFEDPV